MNRPLLLAALAGALIMAPQALANVEVTATCTQANAHLFNWPAGPLVIDDLTVTVGGTPVRTGPYAFTGPAATVTVPLAVHGQAVVDVTATHAGRRYSVSQPVTCPSPEPVPAPEPEPPVTPPVTPPPPVIVTPTCADLARVGAGRKWLVRFGCPIVRKTFTCADLKAMGAGRSWYARLGIYYAECHVPVPRPVPHPPVTG